MITFGEIYEGIFFGRDPERAERVFRQFLRSVPVLPLTKPVLLRFARLRGELRRRGELIGDMDLLIAATAMQARRTLVSRNLRDFGRVPGLPIHGRV